MPSAPQPSPLADDSPGFRETLQLTDGELPGLGPSGGMKIIPVSSLRS